MTIGYQHLRGPWYSRPLQMPYRSSQPASYETRRPGAAPTGTRRQRSGDFCPCRGSVRVKASISAETADLLGATTTAVNSMLRRARARARAPLSRAASAAGDIGDLGDLGEPTGRQRRLLDQYAAAFENADGTALARLLREDAVLEMPPSPTWFTGRDQIAVSSPPGSCASPAISSWSGSPPTASPGSPPTGATATAASAPARCRCSPSTPPASPASSPSTSPSCSRCSACPPVLPQ